MDMEKTMKDYIVDEIENYRKCVLQIDEDKFTNDVLKSFKDAKTYRHYVILIPAGLDEYYSLEEHNIFSKNGYYQQEIPHRFDNRFYIPPNNIKHMADVLVNEKMFVDIVQLKGLNSYVVTINGIHDSYFKVDFEDELKDKR